MAFCEKCGAQLDEGARFCASCGQAVNAPPQADAPPAGQQPPQYQAPPPGYQPPPPPQGYPPPPQGYQQPPQGYPPPPTGQQPPPQGYGQAPQGYPPPPPGGYQQKTGIDEQDNKGMAILAYIIFFIPLITGDHKKSPFVKFHTNQALVLWIFAVGYSLIATILTSILSAIFISTFAWSALAAVGVIGSILWIAALVFPVFVIIGIINANGGQWKPLPLIGSITILK